MGKAGLIVKEYILYNIVINCQVVFIMSFVSIFFAISLKIELSIFLRSFLLRINLENKFLTKYDNYVMGAIFVLLTIKLTTKLKNLK